VAFFLLVDALTTSVEPLEMLPLAVRDSQDEPILGMALAGRATHVVTGDDDLLVLAGDAVLGDLRIVTPRVFLDELARWGGGEDA
jgi:predicted nucleic acid-binding protein